jgi:hypothetical protein
VAQYVSANLTSPLLGLALQLRADFFGPGATARANLTFSELPDSPGGAGFAVSCQPLSSAQRRGTCLFWACGAITLRRRLLLDWQGHCQLMELLGWSCTGRAALMRHVRHGKSFLGIC